MSKQKNTESQQIAAVGFLLLLYPTKVGEFKLSPEEDDKMIGAIAGDIIGSVYRMNYFAASYYDPKRFKVILFCSI